MVAGPHVPWSIRSRARQWAVERCLAQSEHSVFASCDLLQLEILKGHRQLGEHKDAQI